MGKGWRALSKATCEAPGGHVTGRNFLDVCVTVRCWDGYFEVTVTETRGHTADHDVIFGRCIVTGNSTRLDDALAEAVARAGKAAIETHSLMQAVAEARDAAIDALLQEEKSGEPAA
jgi:hypothetical protein